MKKQPPIFSALGQCALHFVVRFREFACASQRPGQGVMSEDVAARIEFRLGKSKGGLRRLVPRREKER